VDTAVIRGLLALGLVPRVPGIRPTASAGDSGSMDPGDKHRDDTRGGGHGSSLDSPTIVIPAFIAGIQFSAGALRH